MKELISKETEAFIEENSMISSDGIINLNPIMKKINIKEDPVKFKKRLEWYQKKIELDTKVKKTIKEKSLRVLLYPISLLFAIVIITFASKFLIVLSTLAILFFLMYKNTNILIDLQNKEKEWRSWILRDTRDDELKIFLTKKENLVYFTMLKEILDFAALKRIEIKGSFTDKDREEQFSHLIVTDDNNSLKYLKNAILITENYTFLKFYSVMKNIHTKSMWGLLFALLTILWMVGLFTPAKEIWMEFGNIYDGIAFSFVSGFLFLGISTGISGSAVKSLNEDMKAELLEIIDMKDLELFKLLYLEDISTVYEIEKRLNKDKDDE